MVDFILELLLNQRLEIELHFYSFIVVEHLEVVLKDGIQDFFDWDLSSKVCLFEID
jgi:hypothetical protein